MKKAIIQSFLLFAIITTFYACNEGGTEKQSKQNSDSLTELEIGYSRLRISLPVFVAQEEGIFKKHGINAKLVMYETAQPLMQALVEDKIDIAGYTALPITYNGMIKSGKKLTFISAMVEDQKHRISYLLRIKTPEGSTPQIKSIKDLKGKKIGILPTIAYKAWIEEILRQEGLDPDKDVIIQQIAPQQQAQALKAGGVDALFTNDPAATAAIMNGVAELATNTVECPKYISDPFLFGSFNVSKEWADENPDTYKSLIAALNEAIDTTNANPQKAKIDMKKYISESFKPHVMNYPDAYYLRSDQTTDKMFNDVADKYLKIGIIPQSISLTDLVAR